MIAKLTSRKFLACLAGIVIGLATMFGLDATIISTVSGAVIAVGSVVTYIVTEGKLDALALKKAAEAVQEAKDKINE